MNIPYNYTSGPGHLPLSKRIESGDLIELLRAFQSITSKNYQLLRYGHQNEQPHTVTLGMLTGSPTTIVYHGLYKIDPIVLLILDDKPEQ